MKTPMEELIDEMTYMLTEGERSIYALREKARKLLEKEEYTMGLLLNFILVNYETSYQEGFCFTNANGEEVTVSEILEHFYNETFKTKRDEGFETTI